MTNQEIAQKIMEADNQYYKSFSNFINKDYGILYYNTDDPTWTDFNHANITKYGDATDLDVILQEIKNFYYEKSLRPFIYCNFVLGQLDFMKDCLIKNGFIIEDNYGGQNYVIHTSECKINVPHTLKIKKINKDDDLSFIYEIIEDKDDADDIIETKIKLPEFNLFVGYSENGSPVTMADLTCFNGIVLLDDVETAKKHQGKGYARQMIRFLVDYHYKNQKDSILYLYYDNPIAGRIYKEAGFTAAPIENWAAYIN